MKNSTLKLLATFLLTLLVYTVNAQIQVCEGGSVNLKTDVDPANGGLDPDGTSGSFYTWSADNGATYTDFAPGSNPNGDSNKATINFAGVTVGTTVTITVVETSGLCEGDPIDFFVEIIASADVTAIAATSPALCDGTGTNNFTITGTPGAIVDYSLVDVLGNTTTGTVTLDATTGIATVAVPAGVGTSTITIVSVDNGTCENTTATAAWTASITVSAQPLTSPIQVL